MWNRTCWWSNNREKSNQKRIGWYRRVCSRTCYYFAVSFVYVWCSSSAFCSPFFCSPRFWYFEECTPAKKRDRSECRIIFFSVCRSFTLVWECACMLDFVGKYWNKSTFFILYFSMLHSVSIWLSRNPNRKKPIKSTINSILMEWCRC